MKTTNRAYELISEKLMAIETKAAEGVVQKNPKRCCFEISALVKETYQVLKNNFYITGGDEPPAA